MEDYNELKRINNIRRKTQSKFIRENLMNNVREYLNGENIFRYFTVSKQVDKNTYAVLQYIDLMPLIAKGVNIKDNFELEINISKIKIYVQNEDEKFLNGNWSYKLSMKKDDSKNVIYEPNLKSNKATLKKLVLTPDTTEVEVHVPKEFGVSAYILAYDDKGNMLDGHTFSYNLESNLGTLEYKKFTPISKDSKYILVKVVDKSKQSLDVFSEFKVLLK